MVGTYNWHVYIHVYSLLGNFDTSVLSFLKVSGILMGCFNSFERWVDKYYFV